MPTWHTVSSYSWAWWSQPRLSSSTSLACSSPLLGLHPWWNWLIGFVGRFWGVLLAFVLVTILNYPVMVLLVAWVPGGHAVADQEPQWLGNASPGGACLALRTIYSWRGDDIQDEVILRLGIEGGG